MSYIQHLLLTFPKKSPTLLLGVYLFSQCELLHELEDRGFIEQEGKLCDYKLLLWRRDLKSLNYYTHVLQLRQKYRRLNIIIEPVVISSCLGSLTLNPFLKFFNGALSNS